MLKEKLKKSLLLLTLVLGLTFFLFKLFIFIFLKILKNEIKGNLISSSEQYVQFCYTGSNTLYRSVACYNPYNRFCLTTYSYQYGNGFGGCSDQCPYSLGNGLMVRCCETNNCVANEAASKKVVVAYSVLFLFCFLLVLRK